MLWGKKSKRITNFLNGNSKKKKSDVCKNNRQYPTCCWLNYSDDSKVNLCKVKNVQRQKGDLLIDCLIDLLRD